MALDSNGNVYLVNARSNTLSCYERGQSKASSIVSGRIVVDILIDQAGDVYASGFDLASKSASIVVYHGCGLQLIRSYPFGATAMTLVPAISQPK